MRESGFKKTANFPHSMQFLRDDPRSYATPQSCSIAPPDWRIIRPAVRRKLWAIGRECLLHQPSRGRSRTLFRLQAVAVPAFSLLPPPPLPQSSTLQSVALTLHESAPDTAFQIRSRSEHKNQPEFRQHAYISAYGEGWRFMWRSWQKWACTNAIRRFGYLVFRSVGRATGCWNWRSFERLDARTCSQVYSRLPACPA